MKLICLFTIALFASVFTNGQSPELMKQKPWDTLKLHSLSPKETDILREYLHKDNYVVRKNQLEVIGDKLKVQNKMGVLKLPLTTKYLGNNGKGAVVYSVRDYNIPGIKPDSTFVSAMPIGRMPY